MLAGANRQVTRTLVAKTSFNTMGFCTLAKDAVTNPNFKIDAFEMVTLWLMYEKQKGCRSDVRTEFKISRLASFKGHVLFEHLTEIIFQRYHQIVNVLFHFTIALNN